MKSVLITGGSGYIAKSLYDRLKDLYEITIIDRSSADLRSFKDTRRIFRDKQFHAVIHCAVSGVDRVKTRDWNILDSNLSMYYNLLQFQDHYQKMIHFGSGAEIYMEDLPYGLSKSIIRKSILHRPNFYSLRIFSVFDDKELNKRFIKANILRYINNEPMIVNCQKKMDFFYMDDLSQIVDHYIKKQHNELAKEVDCIYETSYTLLDIANMINQLDTHKVPIVVDNKKESDYVGSYNLPENISLVGFREGVRRVYDKLKTK